jgi:hypothetical protein
MPQARKRKSIFGMKVRIGVDAEEGLVFSVM